MPSSRVLFLAGAIFAVGSLSAGIVHCAQVDAPPAWQHLADPAVAQAAAKDPARFAPKPVPADARCSVCGMYPARYPQWAAQLLLRDGSARYFDSPLEFFVFQRDLARRGKGVTVDDIVAGYVTDYDKGGWISATDALYVRGSDVRGPMGNDALPAFATRVAASAFATAHGGEVLVFGQVTAEVLDAMAGDAAHHHH